MIYTEIATTLADVRQRASSVTQLMMLDQVVSMLADALDEYKNFNRDMFMTRCKYGYGVPIYSQMEEQ